MGEHGWRILSGPITPYKKEMGKGAMLVNL